MKKEPETTPPTSTKRRRSDLAARARDDDTSSNTGEDELDEDVKPEIKPEPKKRQRRQPSKSDEPKSGQWTPTKRAILMEKVISAGYKSLDLDQVANEVCEIETIEELTCSWGSTSVSSSIS